VFDTAPQSWSEGPRRGATLYSRYFTELPDDLAVCIASIEVLKRNMLSEDGTTELVWKIKLWNKAHALELLGKYHGLGDTPLDARPQVPAFTLPPGSRGVSVH
jgi:hypothetical protein